MSYSLFTFPQGGKVKVEVVVMVVVVAVAAAAAELVEVMVMVVAAMVLNSLSEWSDFHEIWHQNYATRGYGGILLL